MQIFNEQIDKAISFAVKAHKDQFRKTDSSLPYIYHPVSVGFILIRAGFSDDVVIAGILHDVIEDCGITSEELKSVFGEKITDLVQSVSENKNDSWEKRKQDYSDRIMKFSPEVKAIAAADKLHNIYSLINTIKTGGDIDKLFKKDKMTTVDYYTNFTESLIKNWFHPIVDELRLASEQLRKEARI